MDVGPNGTTARAMSLTLSVKADMRCTVMLPPESPDCATIWACAACLYSRYWGRSRFSRPASKPSMDFLQEAQPA
jgi:hypothetical protein